MSRELVVYPSYARYQHEHVCSAGTRKHKQDHWCTLPPAVTGLCQVLHTRMTVEKYCNHGLTLREIYCTSELAEFCVILHPRVVSNIAPNEIVVGTWCDIAPTSWYVYRTIFHTWFGGTLSIMLHLSHCIVRTHYFQSNAARHFLGNNCSYVHTAHFVFYYPLHSRF